MEWQPAGGCSIFAGAPLMPSESVFLFFHIREAADQLLGIRVLGVFEDISYGSALSTIFPAYMTAILSQVSPQNGKVVSDENQPHVQFLSQPLHRFRICACTMTSSAVVGSSPMTTLGLQARPWQS